MKLKTYILSLTMAGAAISLTTSCDDMLDKGNNYVIYANDHMLTNPADTVTSVLGILNKLQGIAVRTNLLGEVRADLVNINSDASSDLKELSNLSVSDDNKYNNPRDYYAVINNCNYYLAHVDSLAGNINRNEKYFEAEIAQVHSIRAWTYLQLVLVYGRVPLVTEPVLTKKQSDASYPMVELSDVCEYFIKDLQPYYGHSYPEYTTIGDDIAPKFCFFPTQVVMGDLHLWLAAKNQDKEEAKKAAKCYYDYIVWDLNGKINLYTGTGRSYWNKDALSTGKNLTSPSSTSYYSGTWGGKWSYDITKIPMDSAAADGYYNELRKLYNTDLETLSEASISPSSVLKGLSESQEYYDWDKDNNTVQVTQDKFTEQQINKGYVGDLRYASNYQKMDYKLNQQEIEYQYIRKHSSQHISIYRSSELYLRLAEALNYAGYPRFARQILTQGLSNIVIDGEVSPYYTSPQDSAFIGYFDFNSNAFVTYVQSYRVESNDYGVVMNYTPIRVSSDAANMMGIHSMGSGLAFLNPNYCKLELPDSTSYPHAEEAALGKAPSIDDYTWPEQVKAVKEPSTWNKYPYTSLSSSEYATFHGIKNTTSETYASKYNKYVDSIANYTNYIDVALPAYEAAYAEVYNQYSNDSEAFMAKVEAFYANYKTWYNAAYSDPVMILKEQKTVDQAILDEQALELCYEGHRYYDLMRRAMWWGDSSKLANAVGKRTSAGSLLLNPTNWYLNWKGKIGY